LGPRAFGIVCEVTSWNAVSGPRTFVAEAPVLQSEPKKQLQTPSLAQSGTHGFQICPIPHRLLDLLVVELAWNLSGATSGCFFPQSP